MGDLRASVESRSSNIDTISTCGWTDDSFGDTLQNGAFASEDVAVNGDGPGDGPGPSSPSTSGRPR